MRFDSYHPTINLIYFTAAIVFAVIFDHPVFMAIAYVSAFAYSVKLGGKKTAVFNICLIPLILAYGVFYSYYNHFGITELRSNIIGNSVTLEALLYGMSIGLRAASVVMMFSCVFRVFSSDKVMYLFGRVSPVMSLFFSIMLRCVPRTGRQAVKISIAQKGIGRGTDHGNPLKRLINLCRIISIVITWMLESFVESSRSMKSRGYMLKGRTAFSIYRFDNRDRSMVILMAICLTLIFMAVMLDQTGIYYDPEIVMNRVTPVSYIFYISYAVLLLMPMILQIISEKRFERLRRTSFERSVA